MIKWIFEKFKGDMAIYAICPKCGYRYSCSSESDFASIEIDRQFKYCPMCGKYLFDERSEIEVIWNKRDIVALYEMEK